MKLLKTVPAIVMLAGGMFASLNAAADDSVFTVMDDPASAKKPFEGNLNAGYLAQSGNTKSSSLTADTTMTWYGHTTAWSLWGNTPIFHREAFVPLSHWIRSGTVEVSKRR